MSISRLRPPFPPKNDDPVGEIDGLLEIIGDKDHCHLVLPPDAGELFLNGLVMASSAPPGLALMVAGPCAVQASVPRRAHDVLSGHKTPLSRTGVGGLNGRATVAYP